MTTTRYYNGSGKKKSLGLGGGKVFPEPIATGRAAPQACGQEQISCLYARMGRESAFLTIHLINT